MNIWKMLWKWMKSFIFRVLILETEKLCSTPHIPTVKHKQLEKWKKWEIGFQFIFKWKIEKWINIQFCKEVNVFDAVNGKSLDDFMNSAKHHFSRKRQTDGNQLQFVGLKHVNLYAIKEFDESKNSFKLKMCEARVGVIWQ